MAAIRTYDASTVGSQEVIAVVKKRQKPGMILFCTFSGILLAMGIIGFFIENYVLFAIMLIFLLPFLIPAIIFIYRYTHPMKCRPLKKNPVVLNQADWMFKNLIAQNDLVVVSQNFFAPKSDISAIIPVQEVLLMYKRVIETNFTTMNFWVVDTVRGTTQIPYLKNQEPLVEQSVNYIIQLCPLARIGHNQENLNYREYMKTMWEQTQINQEAGQSQVRQ